MGIVFFLSLFVFPGSASAETVFSGEDCNFDTVIGDAVFEDNACNAGTVTGNAIFNGSSYNAGNITGDSTFNTTYYSGSAPSGGVFTFSDSDVWQGTISGTIYGSDDLPITSYVFNDASYTTGDITGDATFNTTYYSGSAPSDGVFIFSGLVTLQGTISGTIYGSDDLPITSYVFNDASGNYSTLTGAATFNNTSNNTGTVIGTATFNGSSLNFGTITGDATFNGDLTELEEGSVSGTKTRRYTSSITVTRDFVTDGPWTVVAEGAGVVVTVTDATYDGTTTFLTLSGGAFVPSFEVVAEVNDSAGSGGPPLFYVTKKPEVIMQFVPSPPKVEFTDISDHWGKDYIEILQEKCGIMGYTDTDGDPLGLFGPDNSITRAELVKMVVGCTYDTLPEFEAVQFKDVEDTMWYAPYIGFARSAGWIDGYHDGTFRPDHNVTRIEALKIIMLSQFSEENIVGGSFDFDDTEHDQWYSGYLAFAILKGFMEGYTTSDGAATGLFGPATHITRAESAKVIAKILDVNVN